MKHQATDRVNPKLTNGMHAYNLREQDIRSILDKLDDRYFNEYTYFLKYTTFCKLIGYKSLWLEYNEKRAHDLDTYHRDYKYRNKNQYNA